MQPISLRGDPIYLPSDEFDNPDKLIKIHLPIYITHYTPNKERKIHMNRQLADHGLTGTFVEVYDREFLTDFELSYFDRSKINLPCISNLMKLVEGMKRLIHSDDDYALYLDDDACLAKTFNEEMKKTLENLPPDWDACWIGDACELHIERPKRSTSNVFLKSNEIGRVWTGGRGSVLAAGSSRGMGFLLTKQCAKKLLSMFKSGYKVIALGGDEWFNQSARVLNLRVYWAEPTFMCGGSDFGVFGSTLQHAEWRKDPMYRPRHDQL
jgi:hypothetical protein